MTIRVEEYLKEDGSNPYKAWFDSLDPRAAAKVTTAKLRLELGNISSAKWFDGLASTSSTGALATVCTWRRTVRH